MKKLFDLRFVIGAFFTVVGAVLLIYHFVSASASAGSTINLGSSLIFLVFGIIMIVLSYSSKMDDDAPIDMPQTS